MAGRRAKPLEWDGSTPYGGGMREETMSVDDDVVPIILARQKKG